jgi:TolA-binding protein
MQSQDTIDAYVKGQLTVSDRIQFEAEMARNSTLAEAVAQARLDLEVANLLIGQEVQGWMNDWAKEVDWGKVAESAALDDPPKLFANKRNGVFFLWIAAAATLTLVLAAVLFFQPGHPVDEPLIAISDSTQQISPPVVHQPDGSVMPQTNPAKPENPANQMPVLPTPRRDSRYIAMAETGFQYKKADSFLRGGEVQIPASQRDSIELAVEALQQKAYSRALNLASAVPPSSNRYADAQLLLGQVYFQQQQYPKATKAFQKAIVTGKIGKDQALWNLLMCLVAQYDTRKVEADALLLQILADEGNPYTEEAQNLAKKLKE